MKSELQLKKWLEGNSIHDNESGQCCPDFSCCRPELLASIEERKLFIEHPEARDQMLMMFLGAALKDMNVYIAGDIETKET